MADAGTIDSSTQPSSAPPPTPPKLPELTANARKSRANDFLRPDSPRKRRRSGASTTAIPATPPSTGPLTTPASPKYSVSPPTLTAAQALLDQRKHRRLQEAVLDRQTSPNTARTALLALQGKQMVSEEGSENAVKRINTAGEPMAAASKMTHHQSPVPMQQSTNLSSGFGPRNEMSAAPVMDDNHGPVASPGRMDDSTGNDEASLAEQITQRPRRQETDPGESRSDKALTYPGPLPNYSQADRRRNTHSGFGRDSGSKSPSSTKKHQCPYCSTTFTRHHNLKSHLLTHSHEKPYYCDTCDSRFRRLHDLKRHSKLHTGERPHTCPKCHRSFARGDALARHSKGAGGCAGRRSSLGGDGADEDEVTHGLDYRYRTVNTPPASNGKIGMIFSGEASHEPEKMDLDTDVMDLRKGSLPSIKGSVPSMNGSVPSINHSPADAHTSYAARQPSTYPPIAGRQPNPGGLYPPMASPGAGSNTSNSPRQASFNPTLASSTFTAASQNVFAQGGAMTESPKPLSPGSHQLGHPDPNISRNRSPSLTQSYQQQQFGRRASVRSSPPPMAIPLIPPGSHPGAPHLPSLPGLPPPDLRFTLHSQAGAPPHIHPNTQGSGPSASSPGYHSQSGNNSLSSQSAEGSSQNPYGQGSDRVWAYIRSLEVKIDRLQEEVGSLKSQLSIPR